MAWYKFSGKCAFNRSSGSLCHLFIYLFEFNAGNLRLVMSIQYAHRLFHEPNFFAYRTLLLANRIIFGKTRFFLAFRYSMVRDGTLKVRFVKKSMRLLYILIKFIQLTYWHCNELFSNRTFLPDFFSEPNWSKPNIGLD
jgi:hypothetical protein